MTRSKTSLFLALLAAMSAGTAVMAEMGPGGPGEGGPLLLEKFAEIDANADGKLTLEEIEAHRAAEFATADANGDGELDTAELSNRILAQVQERMAERVQHMLDNRDNDGNGTLSAAEVGQGPAIQHFARIDSDNDGAISLEEAETAMQRFKKRWHGMGHGGMDGDEG